jgi:dTDP-glucose 4,6-dehydratase
MDLLVTGGAGFIGSAFVRALLGPGLPGLDVARVTVLDRLTYAGNRANLASVAADPRLTVTVGDIRDAELVDQVLPGHDAVLHVAAETHVDRSIASGAAFASTNVVGTQVLLDAAVRHGVRRFLQVSTDEVYGSIPAGTWDEAAPLDPRSAYSATKAGADLLALAYHHTHALPVVVTRCANNYGPYQHPEKLIPRFVTRLLDGRSVPLYGDGGHVRDWLHVEDHCRALARALVDGRAGQVYHVAGGTELTNRDLTGLLLAACGAGWDRVQHVADRKGHDRRYALCDARTRQELGWAPRVEFARGLTATVAWYREHRPWWEPLAD